VNTLDASVKPMNRNSIEVTSHSNQPPLVKDQSTSVSNVQFENNYLNENINLNNCII